jgi:hypothetical protein
MPRICHVPTRREMSALLRQPAGNSMFNFVSPPSRRTTVASEPDSGARCKSPTHVGN